MRVAGPMYIDVMNELGANPQQMQWTETFSALQQGVVDGQEKPDRRRDHSAACLRSAEIPDHLALLL